jgi:two-component system OmpR family sensor kinase
LRARLIALVLVVVAAALIAVDVVIPLVTRSSLIGAKDQTLASVVSSLRSALHNSGPIPLEDLASLSENNPLGGQIGWSVAQESGTARVIVPIAAAPKANPAVQLSTSVTSPATVADANGADSSYRALGYRVVLSLQGQQQHVNVVAWVPLNDVYAAVRRLVVLEVLISLGLLVLVGGIARFVVRRELRPLETMAQAADEIAAGDLSRRVDPGARGTEVGRLGTAFNGMVDGVSALLAERAESERRMRQFVADASHELRTPVAAIRGYTDLYRAGALPEQLALDRAMDRMGFESKRMGALVEDLLTLTHTDAETAAPTEPVDLVPLLTGVVDDAAVIDRARIWRLAGTATRAVVPGDRLRLHQLFANLLANVRTHTPAGTTATVSVTATDYGVTVAVIDDGPGVADQDLPRLFDRFFRADASRSRERGGSGLGLSIAAAIVRTHRGRIHAAGTPGGGLTVTVMLPVAPTDAAGDAAGPARATSGTSAGSATATSGASAGSARATSGTSADASSPPDPSSPPSSSPAPVPDPPSPPSFSPSPATPAADAPTGMPGVRGIRR